MQDSIVPISKQKCHLFGNSVCKIESEPSFRFLNGIGQIPEKIVLKNARNTP